MGRPEKPVDGAGGPVERFASGLRRLRGEAGSPTYREMARCALFSASVLSSAASGYRLPTLEVALAYVRACGGDAEEWRRRWLEAQRGTAVPLASPDKRAARAVPAPAPVSLSVPASLPMPASVPASLPASLPVPASLLPRPAQLPLRSGALTGRQGELARLASGGPGAGPVVICGPAGTGKSELALAYAHHLAGDMADGQLYADLAGATPAAVVDGFLHALGVPAQQLPAAAGQRAGLYRSLLAQRRVVVVLENACCERQVRPLLAESRRSVLIVVGRAPLLGLGGVRRVRLGVLSRPESLAHIAGLLPRRAQQDPAACDQLAALCADLPLALDIATRKLAARPEVPLRHLVDRLREPSVMLDWLRLGDLSVRDMLDAAWAQLDDTARALLGRLTRPGGGPPAPSPRQHPLAPPPGEEDHYEQLAEAGMLRWAPAPGQYRVDPLVTAYMHELAQLPHTTRHHTPATHPLPPHTLHTHTLHTPTTPYHPATAGVRALTPAG